MSAPQIVQNLLLDAAACASVSTGHSRVFFCAHTGTSMNPTLCNMDMLEVTAYADNSARPGDVILFRHESRLIVHRVVAVSTQGIHTKGDSNTWVDSWRLDKGDILGQVTAALRGNSSRVIHGGLRGRMKALTIYSRLKTGRTLTAPLRLIYHALIQSGTIHKLTAKLWQPSVIIFNASDRYPMHLRFGQRTIGRFDSLAQNWIIRRPFDLLVDEPQLPKSLAR